MIQIVVATDVHLGYLERDEERGNDSFLAFEEVLKYAREQRADMLLLAGDLFHDHRPSQETMARCIQLLRTYCLGDSPVAMQVLSDHTRTLSAGGSAFQRPNWEDPHMNVALPVFSIHGNHDEPGRGSIMAGTAPLDVLALTGLVNYFGKMEDLQPPLDVYPVLLQKGASRLALYGLGAIRDAHLNHLFLKNKVQFRRPRVVSEAGGAQAKAAAAQQDGSWFNLMCVHQNRNNAGRGLKNCLQESMLPGFLDLVIWGHEHDSNPTAEKSQSGREFFVVQPGSTVATSLTPGEQKTKHCLLLTIHEQNFMLKPVPLRSVRPFLQEKLVLSDVPDRQLDPHGASVSEQLTAVLSTKVQSMISAAAAGMAATPEHQRPPECMRKPLIRLKVEHTGFSTLNNQRFGAHFLEAVANPGEILLFYRQRVAAAVRKRRAADGPGTLLEGDLGLPFEPEAAEEDVHTAIGNLLRRTLEQDTEQGSGMQLLPMPILQETLLDFATGAAAGSSSSSKKAISAAFQDAVEVQLGEVRDKLYRTTDLNTEDAIVAWVQQRTQKLDEKAALAEDRHAASSKAAGGGAAAAAGGGVQADSAGAKKGTKRGRGGSSPASSAVGKHTSGSDGPTGDDGSGDSSPAASKPKRSRRAGGGASVSSRSSGGRKAGRIASKPIALMDDSSNDSSSAGSASIAVDDSSSSEGGGGRGSMGGRSRASKTKVSSTLEDLFEGDTPLPAGKSRAKPTRSRKRGR